MIPPPVLKITPKNLQLLMAIDGKRFFISLLNGKGLKFGQYLHEMYAMQHGWSSSKFHPQYFGISAVDSG
jgi:hypothetical protein